MQRLLKESLFQIKPMYFLSLPIQFNWEPAFLHSVDKWLSKFSWLSISIPSNNRMFWCYFLTFNIHLGSDIPESENRVTDYDIIKPS